MLPLRDHLPARRRPIVTWALITANVVAFLWELALIAAGGPELFHAWALVPGRFVADPIGDAVTVFSSMFMHAPDNWWHLGGNMLFLWIFGDNVEDALGRKRYLGFYVLSGIAAAAGQILVDPASPIPMVGASGAIAGVLAAYGSLYPWSPVTVLNPIVPLWLFGLVTFTLPAWLVILEFFVVNLLSGLGSLGGAGGGVAFFAHLGGFLAGLVLVRLFFSPPPRPAPRWGGARRRRIDPRVARDPWLGPRGW